MPTKMSPSPHPVDALLCLTRHDEAQAVARYLEQGRGWRTQLTDAPAVAAATVAAHGDSLRACVIDCQLANPSGMELAGLVRAASSHVAVLLVTAEGTEVNEREADALHAERVGSPFLLAEFRDALTSAREKASGAAPPAVSEKRRYPRAAATLEVSLTRTGGPTAPAAVIDLSLGGMRVESELGVDRDAEVESTFVSPLDEELLVLPGRVVRSGSGGEVAIVLAPMPMADRLRYASYVAQCLVNPRHTVLMTFADQGLADRAWAALAPLCYDLVRAPSCEAASGCLREQKPTAVVCDAQGDDSSGAKRVAEVRGLLADVPVVVCVEGGRAPGTTVASAAGAAVLGAPWTAARLRGCVRRLVSEHLRAARR